MIYDPSFDVECDECYNSVNFTLTFTSKGWDIRDITDKLIRNGWKVDDPYIETICPDCREEEEEEND